MLHSFRIIEHYVKFAKHKLQFANDECDFESTSLSTKIENRKNNQILSTKRYKSNIKTT